MKYGESGEEWKISIQGIHLSAFWNIFEKEKECLTLFSVTREQNWPDSMHYNLTLSYIKVSMSN